jgi:bifunctional NMN adenylyltransferase/nudix hydrolase
MVLLLLVSGRRPVGTRFSRGSGSAMGEAIMNATDIREMIFKGEEKWQQFVRTPVRKFIRSFITSETFTALKAEFDYIQKYKEDSKFQGLPFSPTFVTTDAVVTAMGHILVVRRGHQPGKGLLGLPGGFLAQDYLLEDNMLKELKEETRIRVPDSVLRGSIKDKREFDFPYRSLRGRTLTFAYHLELRASLENGLPTVIGGDDADKAFWMPISALGEYEEEFFEDHISIIRFFLGF